jgi:rubrerythrin
VDDDNALKPLREILTTIKEKAEYALGRIREMERVRSMAWACVKCGRVKKFTRRVPDEAAVPCPKCGGDQFQPFA